MLSVLIVQYSVRNTKIMVSLVEKKIIFLLKDVKSVLIHTAYIAKYIVIY